MMERDFVYPVICIRPRRGLGTLRWSFWNEIGEDPPSQASVASSRSGGSMVQVPKPQRKFKIVKVR